MEYNYSNGTVDAKTLTEVNSNFSKYCINNLADDRLWTRLNSSKLRTDYDDQAINFTATLPKFIKIVKDDDSTTTFSYILKEQSSIFPNIGLNGIHDYQTYEYDEDTKTGFWKDKVNLETLPSIEFEVKKEVITVKEDKVAATEGYTPKDPQTTETDGVTTTTTEEIVDGMLITTTTTSEWKTPVEVNSSIVEKVKEGYDIYICNPYRITFKFAANTSTAPTQAAFIQNSIDAMPSDMVNFLSSNLNTFEEIEDENGKVTYKVNGNDFTFTGTTVESRRLLVGFSVFKSNRGKRVLLFDHKSIPASELVIEEMIDTDLTCNFGIEYDLLFVESPADGLVQYKTETYYEGIRIDNPNRV